ncbi:MAG TPA: CHAP domain-containing protein, partial [Candidatus Binatia bacterium]|nr:CHAP domain-containing protein [Candidatus Binatia bacterium]
AYQQGGMQKIANRTRGVPPLPGDVLSYGPATTYGHTSVVKSTNVDGSGNGSMTVVEEDNNAGGSSTLTVTGWSVQAVEPVTGWLHRA